MAYTGVGIYLVKSFAKNETEAYTILIFHHQNLFVMTKVNLFFSALFCMLLFIGLPMRSYAQTPIECGVSSNLPLASFQAAYDLAMQNAGSATIASTTNFEIAVHVVILDDGSGSLNESQIVTNLNSSINAANSYFTRNYSFYLCSWETVSVPSSMLRVNSNNLSELEALYDLGHKDNAVNLYIIREFTEFIGGVAFFPWAQTYANNMMVLIRDQTNRPALFAHEMGHYLGLYHTFNGGPINPSSPCETSGDGICQTPPDPGTTHCGFSCVQAPCTAALGPFIYEYNPLRENLMSYYGGCESRSFVEEQLDVMGVSLFHYPTRQGLFQNQFTLRCNDNIPYPEGIVVRPRQETPNSELQLDAFEDAIVEFIAPQQGVTLCEKNTGDDGQFTIAGCNILPATGDVSYGVERESIGNTSYCDVNGVTTWDLILITRHILNIQLFHSPYQYIAADVNNSGTVTTLDQIRIRRLILGLISEFGNVDSWRFVPAYALENPAFESNFNQDPFAAVWQAPDGSNRGYQAVNGQKSYLDYADVNTMFPDVTESTIWSFHAVKSGDVSWSADVSNMADDACINGLRGDGETVLFTESKTSAELLSEGIATDELLLASVSVGQFENMNLEGYQFAVNFDDYALELVAVEPGSIAFSSEDFVVDYTGGGAVIKTLWHNYEATPVPVSQNEKFFTLVFKPKVNLNSMSNLISFGGNDDMADLVVLNGQTKASLVTLQVDYKKVNIKDFIIKEAYGNPFSGTGNLHIKIELKELKSVNLLLQDEFGHSVMLGYNNLVIGENNIEIPASTVQFLQNGKVYYTIATDEQVQSGFLIKMN